MNPAVYRPGINDEIEPFKQEPIDLSEHTNIHTILKKTIDKFKLNGSSLDALTNDPHREAITEITRQLSLMKFSLKSSLSESFKLVDFQRKFPLVVELINSHFFQMNSALLVSDTDLKAIDYNQLFERMNISSLSHLPLGDVIRTQLLLNGQKTKEVAYQKVVSQFFDEIEDRHLPRSGNFQATEAHLVKEGLPIIGADKRIDTENPNQGSIRKVKLISMIEELERIYVVVTHRDQWKQHIDYLRKRVTESFHSYCQNQKDYQHLLEVKAKIEVWVKDYDQLLNTVKPRQEANPFGLDSVLSQKFEADQLFLAETLKSLNIDEARQKMEMSGKMFKLHQQIVEDLTGCLPKPNCCHICLTHEANHFISTCGHVMCRPCAETICTDNNPNYAYVARQKQSNCPYCNKPFTLADLRKIFYS